MLFTAFSLTDISLTYITVYIFKTLLVIYTLRNRDQSDQKSKEAGPLNNTLRQEVKNYRLITSLLTIDKVFEQLLCKQVTVKLDHIFSSLRTAYRKGHSFETTLLRLNEDWKLAIDRKELVCILSTDMSKAFDSLSHSPTLTKLEAYGFESSALDLTRSFFNNRQNVQPPVLEHISE